MVRYFELGFVQHDEVVRRLMRSRALSRATATSTYANYAAIRNAHAEVDATADKLMQDGVVNRRTLPALMALIATPVLLITEIFRPAGLAAFLSLAAGGGILFMAGKRAYSARQSHQLGDYFFSLFVLLAGGLVILAPYLIYDVDWRPYRIAFVALLAVSAGFLLQTPATMEEFLRAITIPSVWLDQLKLSGNEHKARDRWLDEVAESIIIRHIEHIIHSLIGLDYQKYLVEEDSEGLRKLRDPTLTVSTKSLQRIKRTLSRVDSGSIAIAGPRGAGKSTLLRLMCESSKDDLAVQMSAPAEYLPREFLAELFQRFCLAYLEQQDYSPGPSLIPNLATKKRAFRIIRDTTSATIRSILAPALVVFVIWSLVQDWGSVVTSTLATSSEWYRSLFEVAQKYWRDYPLPTRALVLLIALWVRPRRHKWRSLRWHPEPRLVVQAREHLFRLQVDRTVSWGFNAGVSGLFGGSGTLNRGTSLKHLPWSLPELVGALRHFMEDVGREQKSAGGRVIVAIDEIDRIGSTEKAERFISEIKAVFDVDNCFFLVSVAEDVGSIFGQRALTGKSVFENAFDDIFMVEPLDLKESRILLQQRVPGCQDPFVHLVHSLSGGLPRELLRTTSRLVEMNEELRVLHKRAPRLETLVITLVRDEMVEAMKGARDHLSRTLYRSSFAYVFDLMRISMHRMQGEILPSLTESKNILEDLANLNDMHAIEPPQKEGESNKELREITDIIDRLAVFALYNLTIIEIFSDSHYDAAVAQARNGNTLTSFEELAAIRRELSVSPESSRVAMDRFRKKWSLL
ncbi:hypothetical protein JOL79_16410 [Microbispora sp. RL4-1S]|uniref:KAP NTPase domain-containing protein n=1 Tax=Microbispora oryzae TaxID=2806554 RepID=A0A940WR18_9ACTN|nr:P-loop NTPase fold protein [Microbispora oryzae]MBP2705399.1 hypothetical protein [Microbispora oryzae]